MEVEDEPRYPFRGMHIDVARNFHSKQFIFDLLDQMAAYKLNVLHLHMADDEDVEEEEKESAWRICTVKNEWFREGLTGKVGFINNAWLIYGFRKVYWS